ncbi:MAG: HepT-like ribonuclease domain-containing protein [Phycisphaeraceae bacterium]
MRRETRKLLYDVLDAARFIREQTDSLSYEQFRDTRLIRDAVERNFITIGEALNRLKRTASDVAAQIDEHPHVVAFRNIVVHGYDTVDPAVEWKIIRSHLPALIAKVERLLGT